MKSKPITKIKWRSISIPYVIFEDIREIFPLVGCLSAAEYVRRCLALSVERDKGILDNTYEDEGESGNPL